MLPNILHHFAWSLWLINLINLWASHISPVMILPLLSFQSYLLWFLPHTLSFMLLKSISFRPQNVSSCLFHFCFCTCSFTCLWYTFFPNNSHLLLLIPPGFQMFELSWQFQEASLEFSLSMSVSPYLWLLLILLAWVPPLYIFPEFPSECPSALIIDYLSACPVAL